MTTNTSDPLALHLTIYQVIPLALYCTLGTVFSLLGNSTVLYASIRYNAIKLDRISLLFIRSLALADICYTLCRILPQIVTYIAGKWILGDVCCFISGQMAIIPACANTLTVLAITTYRLRVVTSPFYTISQATGTGVAVGIWVVSLTGAIILLSYKSTATFHPYIGNCISSIYGNKTGNITFTIAMGLLIILPLFIIMVSNAVLCVVAMRSSRREEGNYKALVTVCSLSGLFLLSWSPYIVYLLLNMTDSNTHPGLFLTAIHFVFINSFGNPVLYSCTNKSFGNYVTGVLVGMFIGKSGVKKSGVKKSGVKRSGVKRSGVKRTPQTSGAGRDIILGPVRLNRSL